LTENPHGSPFSAPGSVAALLPPYKRQARSLSGWKRRGMGVDTDQVTRGRNARAGLVVSSCIGWFPGRNSGGPGKNWISCGGVRCPEWSPGTFDAPGRRGRSELVELDCGFAVQQLGRRRVLRAEVSHHVAVPPAGPKAHPTSGFRALDPPAEELTLCIGDPEQGSTVDDPHSPVVRQGVSIAADCICVDVRTEPFRFILSFPVSAGQRISVVPKWPCFVRDGGKSAEVGDDVR
jgi:hypothetical protein